MKEDPLNPGLYYGIDAPEFSTHGAGQIVTLLGPPTLNPDLMFVTYVTARATASYNLDNQAADPNNNGHYRSPTPLSDGLLIASYRRNTRGCECGNIGESREPLRFQIKTIVGPANPPDLARC